MKHVLLDMIPKKGFSYRIANLSLDVVHQPLHAWLHAVRVLARQQLRGLEPVQADAAGQELVELLHLGRCRPKASPIKLYLYSSLQT